MENEVEQRRQVMESHYERQQQATAGGDWLWPYIEVLMKYWWLIVLFTVLAALAALVTSLLITPVYEATAGVLIAGQRSQITLDPRFQTIEDVGGTGYSAYTGQEAHRTALLALVRSGSIINRVSGLLKDELDEEERRPAQLLNMVSATLRQAERPVSSQASGSDFIGITVTSDDPAKAARIADVWAEEYVDYVNQLYGQQSGSFASVEKQTVSAQAVYEQAEDTLLTFMSNEDRAVELEQLIDQKERVITGTLTVFTHQIDEKRDDLSRAYERKDKFKRLLRDARGLRAQMVEGESGSSDQLALMLLKAEAFASSADLPGELHVQIAANDGAVRPAEMDVFISVLEAELSQAEEDIQAFSASLLAGEVKSNSNSGEVTKLQREARQLRAQKETIAAQLKELTRSRDQAWDTYSTLRVKADELHIAMETKGMEVRFAAPAVEPIAPTNIRTSTNIGLAAVVGFMLATCAAFLLHYLSRTRSLHRPASP